MYITNKTGSKEAYSVTIRICLFWLNPFTATFYDALHRGSEKPIDTINKIIPYGPGNPHTLRFTALATAN